MIDDLTKPLSLPDPTEKVSVVQTHISMVFVADEFVYKVKKPVNFGFLDFSTLEKRKHFCHSEVELNRRLSGDIYVDVLPIIFDGTRYTLTGEEGEIAEYAVKMKRIPERQLMKSVFERGALTGHHLQEIARVLADFHANTETDSEIEEFGKPFRFKVNTDENFDQVEKYLGITIDREVFECLKLWTSDFYSLNSELFARRIKSGRIRDCHGDLHMEHVCFTTPPVVIDCIEFNERFRFSDTISDIAFLLMDLEFHGGREHADELWRIYKGLAGEEDVEDLLTFYKVYRAFVRGKVNSFQIDDDHISGDEKEAALQRAKKYFDLAFSYVNKQSP
jgi:aminoglycoside phosphotransferase family enzyme